MSTAMADLPVETFTDPPDMTSDSQNGYYTQAPTWSPSPTATGKPTVKPKPTATSGSPSPTSPVKPTTASAAPVTGTAKPKP